MAIQVLLNLYVFKKLKPKIKCYDAFCGIIALIISVLVTHLILFLCTDKLSIILLELFILVNAVIYTSTYMIEKYFKTNTDGAAYSNLAYLTVNILLWGFYLVCEIINAMVKINLFSVERNLQILLQCSESAFIIYLAGEVLIHKIINMIKVKKFINDKDKSDKIKKD